MRHAHHRIRAGFDNRHAPTIFPILRPATIDLLDEAVVDSDFSLSQFKTTVDDTKVATVDLNAKAREVEQGLVEGSPAFGRSLLESDPGLTEALMARRNQ